MQYEKNLHKNRVNQNLTNMLHLEFQARHIKNIKKRFSRVIVTFSLGKCLRTPPMSNEQMAVAVSAGIPTNQGNQYFECLNISS